MRTSALFGAKIIEVFEIYDVSASQCGHFSNKGEGEFFATLCGSLLWTAPNPRIVDVIRAKY